MHNIVQFVSTKIGPHLSLDASLSKKAAHSLPLLKLGPWTLD